MAEAHPIELRQRLVEAHERGEGGYIVLARRFCVGEASAKQWVCQFRREGHVKPRKKGGGTPSDVSREELDAVLPQHPDANAGKITAEYNRERRGKQRRHVSRIKRALYRAGYVVRKSLDRLIEPPLLLTTSQTTLKPPHGATVHSCIASKDALFALCRNFTLLVRDQERAALMNR